MPARADDAALVEHDDAVGVSTVESRCAIANVVRPRQRRAPPGRALRLRVERARRLVEDGSPGCAGSRARSRCAASPRRRSGSRARRRPCRSLPAARRSHGGCCAAPAAASTSSSVASGFAKRRFSRTLAWNRYVSCETMPTRSESASKVMRARRRRRSTRFPRSRRRDGRRDSRVSSFRSPSRRRSRRRPAATVKFTPGASAPRRTRRRHGRRRHRRPERR